MSERVRDISGNIMIFNMKMVECDMCVCVNIDTHTNLTLKIPCTFVCVVDVFGRLRGGEGRTPQ